MPKCFIVWMDGWMGGWMGGWVDGWMGGWVGGWVGGDFLPPSIFFIFKYHNKQLTLVLKMCLKVASAY